MKLSNEAAQLIAQLAIDLDAAERETAALEHSGWKQGTRDSRRRRDELRMELADAIISATPDR